LVPFSANVIWRSCSNSSTGPSPGCRSDVGCGNGFNTRAAARLATDGEALGVDLSSQMIENARRLAALDGC
jgi:ubiquinone/menaquinone biosynthesis C-methylase UbiE